MFVQNGATVNWATTADPETMVPVGPDALAFLTNNIVICYNLKTEGKTYFKGDNPQICAGISHLTGHLRFPLFAVAESVLRPKIFIITYPDMEKLITIHVPENISYIDIRLSDFNSLITLGNYPKYQIAIWNIHNGRCYADAYSYTKCSRNCLIPFKLDVQVVVQYSKWHNTIIVWELTRSGDQYSLNKMFCVDLSNDFLLSNLFSVAVLDEPTVYVVNDYGDLFAIDDGRMILKRIWSTPKTAAMSHSIFYNKNGLLLLNSEEIYFVKKNPANEKEFYCEWTLQNTDGFIKKLFTDNNNNIHAAARLGNIYRIEYSEQTASFIPKMTTNCYVRDYTNFRGIKDEVVLLLTNEADLRVVDLIRMNTFSKIHIDEANSIAAHNSQPIAAVGTTFGLIYFINYEKVRAPVELGYINIEEAFISDIRMLDNCVFIKDGTNGLHIVMNDYKSSKFRLNASLARESRENWCMLNMFLLDEFRAIVFLCRDAKEAIQYATEAWVYNWASEDVGTVCAEYELPYKYRSLTMLQQTSTDNNEFMAVRFFDTIIDLLMLSKNSTMNIVYSFRTTHLSDVNYISGARNLLTAGTQNIIIHFRLHKKSKTPYMISRALLCDYVPNRIVQVDEYFNAKYLAVLNENGLLICYRLPILADCLRENRFDVPFDQTVIKPYTVGRISLLNLRVIAVRNVTDKDLEMKSLLIQELRSIESAMRDLIDYDLSVIGAAKMNFQKFCLNHQWRQMLNEEARILRETEVFKLLDAITDQARIRDWIFDLIKNKSTVFSTKLRSIFSTIFVESYSTRASTRELLDRFDLFRFYEMEPLEDETEELPDVDEMPEDMGEEEETAVATKALKRYVLEKGANVYEHVMAKDFELQDTQIVMFNQLYNEEAKQAIILTDALKAEFNKHFFLSKIFKDETMANVLTTNATLERIYSNMNCMLCLLKMAQFEPPGLSVPEWQRDENIQKILTVDDSEIKAINRRKQVVVAAAHKSGRMLLWSKEFWRRALIIMMDGVIEKLWEEEIKKTPEPPEFMLKKQEHEFNLEDQKLKREYENKLKLLEEDRKKYLRILRDNEGKTYSLKKHYVMKLNEHIAATNILKMKYDFAIKHERLRLLNMKITNLKRIDCKNRINDYRTSISKIIYYSEQFEKTSESYERGQVEYKAHYEAQLVRDRQLERQFKGHFLNSIPQQLTADMIKIYKKRPKLPNKLFNAAEICFEIGRRLLTKKPGKFPLPQELVDFLNLIKSLDSIENCPQQLEPKHWENFIKLRRQKIESELRLKGLMYYLIEAPRAIEFFTEQIQKFNEAREATNTLLLETTEEYFDATRNQRLELVLTLGQVEINCRNADLEVLKNSVLLHVDDIMKINELIKEAGQKKLKSMQRVALFRRKVIYKEWEHKVVRANIDYLRYILGLIKKCKVPYEFLEVLRNWHRLRELQATTTRVGVIEDIMEVRLIGPRKQLERLDKRISEVRAQLEEKKRENQRINSAVDNVKVNVTYLTMRRDFMGEEKAERLNSNRMEQAMHYGFLKNSVRADYVKILELQTILNITRGRTSEMLPPLEAQCIDPIKLEF